MKFFKSLSKIKKIFIVFILGTVCLAGCSEQLFKMPIGNSKVEAKFPQTAAEIEQLKAKKLAELNSFVKQYTSLQYRTFDQTFTDWNRIQNSIIDLNFFLVSQEIATSNPSVIETGKNTAAQLAIALIVALNQQILPTIVSYLEITPLDTLTPAQKHIAYLQLSEMPSSAFPAPLGARIEKLKQLLSQFPMEAFTLHKGEAAEKISSDGSFSTLTLNICAFPGPLPMLYGGPTPWKERVDSLTKRIKDADADVVCLQEVFDSEAGAALFEKLKDNYSYFYLNIGPRVETIGISSGLFVASKYKIENPNFTLFTDREKVRAYGLFDFDIKSGDQTLGHIATTHLQPFDSDSGRNFRAKELTQIINHLKSKAQDNQTPFFLCGDLNIQWGSNEPAEQLLKENFIDSYNKGRTSITAQDRTCLDFTNYWWKQKRDTPQLELIDYSLLLKNDHTEKYQLETKRVPMGEVTDHSLPDTDHDGLFSVIR